MRNFHDKNKKGDIIHRRAVTEFSTVAGCSLAYPALVFIDIYRLTNGQPCENCNCKPCKLLDRFVREDNCLSRRPSREPNYRADLKTNPELAAEFGITKRQVAKRRIPGTNTIREDVKEVEVAQDDSPKNTFICPLCKTPWEDNVAMLTCPCRDRE